MMATLARTRRATAARQRAWRSVAGLACVLLLVALAPAGATGGEGWYEVSYGSRISGKDRTALAAAGARAVLYRPENRYVTWLDGPARRRVARLDRISSVRLLPPHAKVVPSADGPLLAVIVYGPRQRAAITALQRVATVVRSHRATPEGDLAEVVVRDVADLTAVAARRDVLSIGPAASGIRLLDEGTAQIVAANIRAGGTPRVGYRAFLAEHGLDGAGVVVAIADSGIDDNHPDLRGRVVHRVDYTPLPDYRDSDGHGTHVSGIVGGSGDAVPLATDPDGFAYGQGIAPQVRFVDVGVLGILEEIVGIDEFPPFEQASREAVRAGAVGWNASWGSGEGDRAGYTQTARTMDVITRDADWQTPGAQPFTLVFAAGNSGNAGPGAPTEAKNLIAVASSKSHRAGNIDQVSSFSSRGPTRDGRIGPTVAAPGERVVSTRSLPASVLCNTPPLEAAPFAALYAVCSGTSMAAPHVTGSVALITQWWRASHAGATPSPAMHKALLVNSATDMGVRDIPNRNEGWGRVNLKALFDRSMQRLYVDQEVVLDELGTAYTQQITPADPSQPLKVTLAWSDAPAEPNAAIALVNDLDLRLVAEDGTTYRGNVLSRGVSVPGGSPDRREVVENVFVAEPSGSYRLVVSAENLPGDGVPLSGDDTDQDFALVVSNAVVAPAP